MQFSGFLRYEIMQEFTIFLYSRSVFIGLVTINIKYSELHFYLLPIYFIVLFM